MNRTFLPKARGRIDWKAERDGIDLADVATRLLGPAPGRTGQRGSRLWWRCPFHDDNNPSFVIEPGKPTWHCFGCGEHGDAATLVMKLESLTFPEALDYLLDRPAPSRAAGTWPRPSTRPGPKPPPEGPRGMPEVDALALVAESSARLWEPEGAEALAHLTGPRCLSPETVRTARLGWTPGARLRTKDGRPYSARGIVIPWLDGGRLALVKLRQPEGDRPKYAEAYRDRPGLYPGRHAIRPGCPLVIVEGEFDALVLGQELAGLAAVVTLGSASGRPVPGVLVAMLSAPRWFIATDADDAWDKSAGGWPARARRVRPPGPYKDWTEARQGGVELRRWWSDRLGGNEAPPLFTFEEMTRWPGLDPEPGIIVDRSDPARLALALESLGDDPEERAAIQAEAAGTDFPIES